MVISDDDDASTARSGKGRQAAQPAGPAPPPAALMLTKTEPLPLAAEDAMHQQSGEGRPELVKPGTTTTSVIKKDDQRDDRSIPRR